MGRVGGSILENENRSLTQYSLAAGCLVAGPERQTSRWRFEMVVSPDPRAASWRWFERSCKRKSHQQRAEAYWSALRASRLPPRPVKARPNEEKWRTRTFT